jgi:glycosyltransferase involved in cell wall biosynthesis
MGRYAATLISRLPELAPDVQVYAYGGPAETRPCWLPDAVLWRPTSGSVHRKLAALDSRLRELPRLAVTDGLDIFHSPAVHVRPSLPPVPRLGCPVVATVHDVLPLTFYGDRLPLRLRMFYRWNLRRALSAQRVVTVSEASRREVVRWTGVAAARVVAIPNGVDFPPNPDPSVLREHGIRTPYLLYAGSYEPRKNLTGALACFSEVVRAGHPHQLVAVVERHSGHAAAAHQAIRELGVADRVVPVHSLAEADLRALYTQAEMLLFPSLAEGFGLPPVQAAACGVPVVASDLPVLREVMGDAAEFVDPHDPHALATAVMKLIDDPRRRRELAAAGAEVASRFGVDACVRRHLEVYCHLVASRREAAPVAR